MNVLLVELSVQKTGNKNHTQVLHVCTVCTKIYSTFYKLQIRRR